MVTAITNLGRSGLSDWLVQRFTALVLASYSVFLLGFILATPDLNYSQWAGLFDQLWMRIFSLMVLVSTLAHGWIGLWGVLTDYITERMIGGSALFLRMLALTLYALVNIACFIWGIEILWGI